MKTNTLPSPLYLPKRDRPCIFCGLRTGLVKIFVFPTLFFFPLQQNQSQVSPKVMQNGI